jgi:phenylpropionate dioxygenase-like ring-hydroxylating dioxygenase large terminal subunit
LISLHPDYVMTHRLTPLAPALTRVECTWYFVDDTVDPSYAVEFWDLTNRQDWHVCELSQSGISSRAYTPGPYSNREDLLYAFDRMIVHIHADRA